MELTELTVRSFADLLASNAPAPGGGSTAALEGALGAALSAMVSALTVGRKKYEEHWAFNEDVNQKAEALKETFLVAINKDTDAFNAFTAAMAMPKETPEEKAARSAAMQEALIACTESPYHMMELCVNALGLVESQLGKTNTNAMSDLGAGIVSIFITFALLYWVTMARIVRGQVLQLKKQEYVTAATALGASNGRIIRRHLLPNCVGQLVITTCLQIPSAIFLESFLSFLGLGVSAPMASLGSLCSDALETISLYPYRLVFPGIILTVVVLTLNLVGDGLRDALDPRLKK